MKPRIRYTLNTVDGHTGICYAFAEKYGIEVPR